jgi:dTDP-4-dehydrorhamnose reductase
MNPYEGSKLAGETAAAEANSRCLFVRTAWLFGGGRPSSPEKIRLAADRARAADQPLRVAVDEVGNATPVSMLADRILELVLRATDFSKPEIYHLGGMPIVSRLQWAKYVLRDRSDALIEPTHLSDHGRDSSVPPCAALDTQKATATGIGPIHWQDKVSPPSGTVGP